MEFFHKVRNGSLIRLEGKMHDDFYCISAILKFFGGRFEDFDIQSVMIGFRSDFMKKRNISADKEDHLGSRMIKSSF